MLPRARAQQEAEWRKGFGSPGSSSGFFLCDSGNPENGQERTFQPGLAPRGIVPLLQRMGCAATAAHANGNGIDSQGERNICVRRRTVDARLIPDMFVGGTKRREQRRIGCQLSAWTAAQKLDLPFQLAFRTVARGFCLVADARADTFAQA